ncbi:protein kinase [Streptomyces sp. M2CJ-2]|uniref:protein kinase domain-containing protein n=1 Tax=Streptomyces sp. M2CJ-2 TaxID=2803948 RepID=UPI001923DC58|nr:protein kinase [Streptomyces sp. M2CJ-2]MBL3664795.1 protein kinase [Streptomyces sp. M2CJ-2]
MSAGENGRPDGTGRLLAGRYRVTGQLGRGGMGVVWKALDEVLGREVAVKELRTYTDAAGPELTELALRMRREARAAARVRHPGVIAVHDIAEVDGRPLIVMELVDGPSLDDVLRERGTLDPLAAARIGVEVMDALAAAHRAGVLHRDVKPGNILLDRSGRIVLTDFGIATMEDPGDGSATHLTRSGQLVGSLDYLAPERAQGADPGPASDVWALGATLYAAVEGASPFRRTSTFSTLTAIVTEPLPEPRRAGPLAPALRLLMDKRPESRPEAEEARELLEAVANGSGTDTPTTSLRGLAAPPGRTETQRGVPAVPPGFGSPRPTGPQAATVGSGAVGAHAGHGTVGPAAGPVGPQAGIRGRGRVLLAVAAVTVVLAAAGVTAALLDSPDVNRADTATGDTRIDRSASARADDEGSASPGPTEQGDEHSEAPQEQPDEKEKATTPAPDRPASTAPEEVPAEAASEGGGTGGGTPTNPDPGCHSIGGGKYNCHVGRTATSYNASGTRAGILNAGTNYFYCQQNLGRRETYREWTNVWWAKTDDDSGNTDVWVSVVYVRGGDNDGPVPGLPFC